MAAAAAVLPESSIFSTATEPSTLSLSYKKITAEVVVMALTNR